MLACAWPWQGRGLSDDLILAAWPSPPPIHPFETTSFCLSSIVSFDSGSPPRYHIAVLLRCSFKLLLNLSHFPRLGQRSDTAIMSAEDSEPRATTAAPNNTTGQAETAIVPETKGATSDPGTAAAAATVAASGTSETPANGNAAKDAKPSETAPPAEEQSKAPPAPIQRLWSIAKAHDHPEIWGVQLADPNTHVPSQIVFQKFLNAYDGDLDQAKETLIKTLHWRQQTKPLDLLTKAHQSGKFDGLGYVTSYGPGTAGEPESKEVFTWNIYGGVSDINKTFGDLQE